MSDATKGKIETMEQDERELPTIQEIEVQIWKIARSNAATPTQLEACRTLFNRTEALEIEARSR